MVPSFGRSLEELRGLAEGPGGGGVWSILLSSDPRQCAEFANRYQDMFNSIADRTWHLAVGAVHAADQNFSGEQIKYAADGRFHEEVKYFASALSGHRRKLSELHIVFFDPRRTDQGAPAVVLPFDGAKISRSELYRSGFQAAHDAVLQTFKTLQLSPYDVIPIEKSDEFFNELQRQLHLAKLISFSLRAGRFIVTSLLAGLISYPMQK